MGGAKEPRRAALFGLACAALLAAALAFSSGTPQLGAGRREAENGTAPVPSGPPAFALRAAARARRLAAALRQAARRFLVAFLRYEVGGSGPRLAAALRATATPRFARQLLRAPPRLATAGAAAPARLSGLQLAFLSAAASRALVSGSARRDGRPEQLSFLFARRHGRWLASGPGQ